MHDNSCKGAESYELIRCREVTLGGKGNVERHINSVTMSNWNTLTNIYRTCGEFIARDFLHWYATLTDWTANNCLEPNIICTVSYYSIRGISRVIKCCSGCKLVTWAISELR
eukprot:238591-Amphidinium_carterae.1